jgi:enamine deaminase RidA (YjgF/YER057c/UK114 family)
MASAENRLRELGIELPSAPTPFGAYVEAVQTGRLLFLSGMLPISGGKPGFVGRLGAELDDQAGREATRMATLNALAAARQHLRSLDRITKIVRTTVYLATSGDFVDQPRVADEASELLRDIFGTEKMSTRLVLGAASIPLGLPVAVDLLFEVESA